MKYVLCVDAGPFVFISVFDQYKTQELLKYCLNRYKNLEKCDKAVDIFLPTLKFVPNWLLQVK